MNKMPKDYKEWRAERLRLCKWLGIHVASNIQSGKPLMDRVTWNYADRIRRIELRMMAEKEAMTTSYCDALLEMIECS